MLLTRVASAAGSPVSKSAFVRATATVIPAISRSRSPVAPSGCRSFWQSSALANPVSTRTSPGCGSLLSHSTCASLGSSCPGAR
jgi:hypothetical protein